MSRHAASSHVDENGYQKACELLQECQTRVGFLASPTDSDNYRRIWSRDGVILSLAALLTEEPELIEAARETLHTLARYQGPHGEIPSNVDPAAQRVSYGGTTGRVDACLWFVIGCGEYWKASGDREFIEKMVPVLEKIRFLLGAWEFNNRGLIYVPQAGDWADEYLHSGYVLYDQLLYLQALRTFRTVHQDLQGTSDHSLEERIAHLKHLIRANYWFHNGDGIPDDAYHEILYRKGREAASGCAGRYWMPFFSPTGYGYRFDAFANILASLLDVAEKEHSEAVDGFIHTITPKKLSLIPAFYPVIQPPDRDWTDLQMTFSYTFKNKPHEYHNGGLWPMLTGFYVADLARRGKGSLAQQYLAGIHQANALESDEEAWSFPEFVHGRKFTPGGTRKQGWSAAAALIGHWTIKGKSLFRIDHD